MGILGIRIKFECPSCNNIMTKESVFDSSFRFKQPSRCSCGRKGHFKIINFEKIAFVTIAEIDDKKGTAKVDL